LGALVFHLGGKEEKKGGGPQRGVLGRPPGVLTRPPPPPISPTVYKSKASLVYHAVCIRHTVDTRTAV